jgi:hypothetical protein
MYFSSVVQCARPTLDQRVDPGPPLGRRYDLFSWRSVARSALFWLSAALAASAQTAPPDHPSTDGEKIADALRAGPRFITEDATLLDWPTTRGGEYRVLRQGSNEWTCLPGFPGWPHDEPACFDPTFMQWMKESLAVASLTSTGSGSRTCTRARGYRINRPKITCQ